MRIKNEPALAVALLQALIAAGVSFGLNLSAEQVGAIVTLVTAVAALFVRQHVTPLPQVPEPDPAPPADPGPARTPAEA